MFPIAFARLWKSFPSRVTTAPSLSISCSRLKSHLLSFLSHFFMSPLRATYICLLHGKIGFLVFFRPQLRKNGSDPYSAWMKYVVCLHLYIPENLGSGGLLPTELRGRVCLFLCLSVCPSRYDARHRKPRRCVYALNLGGTGISPPGKRPPGKKCPAATYSIAAVAGN